MTSASAPSTTPTSMIVVAPGTSTSLIPERTSTNANAHAQRALGHRDREVRADQHARDRADEQPGHRVQVDVAVQQVARAGDPEQHRRVEHVGADDLRRGQRIERAASRGRRTCPSRPRSARRRTRRSRRSGSRRPCRAARGWNGASLCLPADERLDREADAAEDQRAADDLAHRRLGAVRERARDLRRRRATAAPSRASIQSASGACTLPSWRWRTAPNDLKIAPWRMSVPTAAFGSKPKSRISIGVIRLPPPIPVIPTRIPTAAPARANCQVRRAVPAERARDERPAAQRGSASLYASQPVQKPVTAASSASAATSSPSPAPSVGSAGRVGDRRGREHDEADDVRGARRARVLERPSPKRGWISSK